MIGEALSSYPAAHVEKKLEHDVSNDDSIWFRSTPNAKTKLIVCSQIHLSFKVPFSKYGVQSRTSILGDLYIRLAEVISKYAKRFPDMF